MVREMRLAVLATVDLVAVQVDVVGEPHGLDSSADCADGLGTRVDGLTTLEPHRASCCKLRQRSRVMVVCSWRLASSRKKAKCGEIPPAQITLKEVGRGRHA